MTGKVILVVVDGLNHATARQEMGHLEALVAHGRGSVRPVRCALPSLSRPLYETLHTGLAPVAHGIVSNEVVRPSRCESLFHVVTAHGRRTAAAAFSWFSELYNGTPYDPVEDREVDDPARPIQAGRFYTQDDFPDIELIRQGTRLLRRHTPDYLLVHPMGCDHMGHLHGGTSPQYRRQAARIDDALALHLPEWLAAGYHVLVTADHGMNADGNHGGTADAVTLVPLYHLPPEGGVALQPAGEAAAPASQLAIAPTVLRLMGLPVPAAMAEPALL